MSAVPQLIDAERRPARVYRLPLPRPARIVGWVRLLVLTLVRWWPWLLAANRLKVDRSRKCPACGVCQFHEIVWNEYERVVQHTCAVCKCRFGEKPVVADAQFLKKPEILEGER